MLEENIKRNWFALYTHSRCEVKVEELLEEKKINNYLPLNKTVKIWSDRKKEIMLPLFPGYIFINATEKERLTALQTKFIVRCISDAGKPSIVPDWQIDNLKMMLRAEREIDVIEGLVKGNEVEINTGPFKGIHGTVADIKNKKHLAISIKLLNRSVITHLSPSDILEVVES